MATKKKLPGKKICMKCGRERVLVNFYASTSAMFSDQRVPVCKDCLKEMVNPKDLNTVKTVLRQIDKPYRVDVWNKAVESPKDTFGEYMRMISSLPQYKGMTYEDSVEGVYEVDLPEEEQEEEYSFIDEFRVTPDIVFKWGTGYKPKEYMRLEDLYVRMIESHDISAPQHKELLKIMCVLNLKMEICLEKDDINGFAKLHDQYQKLLQSSGFRPIDRKSGDEATGLKTFSQIFEEVERDGFIEPWEIEEDQDIIDRTIMYLLNYQKKLLHQELLSQPPSDTPKVGEE